MAFSQSSQSFVQALKAASDPPNPGAPFKIHIARDVWDNTSFYVPNKAEVIADWILTKFAKDKTVYLLVSFIFNVLGMLKFGKFVEKQILGWTLGIGVF